MNPAYAILSFMIVSILLLIYVVLEFEIFMPRRHKKIINGMKLKMLIDRLIKEDRTKQFRKAR